MEERATLPTSGAVTLASCNIEDNTQAVVEES